MLNVLVQLIFLNLLCNVRSENILAVFPTPSISPNYMFTTLIQELVERGHQITLITANLAFTKLKASKNINAIDVHDKLNKIWQMHNKNIVSNKNRDVISEVDFSLNTTNYLFEELLQIMEVKKIIREKQSYFDLLLLEASFIPLLSFSYIFKAPVILVSSIGAVLDNYDTVGAPTHPFLYPSIFQHRIYNLTYWEKLKESSTYVRLKLKILSSEDKVHRMLKKQFGTNFPSVNELKKNVFALFLNNNPVWSGNQPVSPNVVFMGGMQPNNKEELSVDLQSFLDKSRNGIVYVSFGSNIKPYQLPPKELLKILNVLSDVPYDILLKWDNDRLPGVPKNIKIYKWLPQSLLLAHPKVKLFITQGGIQSTFEAIHAGVPLIGIPIYSDQWHNTEKYINFHIGAQIDLASLTEEKLIDTIYSIINDQSYRTSIIHLRSLMYDLPTSAMKRAIWWTDQLLRPYGIRHLRAPAANISWTEYLELDFVFSLLLLLVVVITTSVVLITLVIRYTLKSIADIKKKMS